MFGEPLGDAALVRARTFLVVGDSLSQPRPWANIRLPDTYAARLQSRYRGALAVVNFGAGSNNTAREVRSLVSHLQGADATYLCIHFGIVDCAPRLMSEVERLVIGTMSRVPFLRPLNRLYVAFKSRHRYRLTKWFPQVQVPLVDFRSNLQRIVAFAREHNELRRLYFVNIAFPGPAITEKSYGILSNIVAYNQAIADTCKELGPDGVLIDVFTCTKAHPEHVVPDDGYHILPPVHDFIAASVAASLDSDIDAGHQSPLSSM